MSTRSAFAAILLLLAATGLGPWARAAAPARPDIVFILADDLGYMDVNAFAARLTGAKPAEMFYETPHLDRLVREGTSLRAGLRVPALLADTRRGVDRENRRAHRRDDRDAGDRAHVLQPGLARRRPATSRTMRCTGGDNIKIQQALLNGSSLDALPAGQPLDQGRDENHARGGPARLPFRVHRQVASRQPRRGGLAAARPGFSRSSRTPTRAARRIFKWRAAWGQTA